MKTVDVFTIGAVTSCVIGTIECSKKVREHPRLFASLVLFALSWALYLPYYYLEANNLPPEAGPEQRELVEIVAGYSAILLMLAAGPLRAEAESRSGISRPKVDATELWAMRALYVITVPHALAFIPAVEGILRTRFVSIVHLALAIAGFFLITQALWALIRGPLAWPRLSLALWCLLLGITAAYSITYLIFVGKILLSTADYRQMPDNFKWLFVPLKLTFCSVFLVLILLIRKNVNAGTATLRPAETHVDIPTTRA